MLLSLVTMAAKVKHYTEIFLLMLFTKIFCVVIFLSLQLDELHLKNHPFIGVSNCGVEESLAHVILTHLKRLSEL